MKILVVGGTRYFGIPMVNALLFLRLSAISLDCQLLYGSQGQRIFRFLYGLPGKLDHTIIPARI
nr:hypothetical protein [Butyrivibrio sp. WCD3002]